jgi:hypothetical protein
MMRYFVDGTGDAKIYRCTLGVIEKDVLFVPLSRSDVLTQWA